jgi:hypothetical protein
VAGLREEVEGLGRDDLPAAAAEVLEVAGLGVRRAADVDDAARVEGVQLFEERLVATAAGRIDDDRGLGTADRHVGEDRFRRAGDEAAVEEAVEGRVLRGLAGGFGADFDAVDGFELAGAGEGEEAGAAIGVDEVLGAGGLGEADGVADEVFEHRRVVLEELPGEELHLHAADLFGDRLARVGDDAFLAVAEEQGGAAFETAGVGPDVLPRARVGGVDRVRRDGALGDVDDAAGRAGGEEADREIGPARGHEVRGDLRAVAVLLRRRVGRLDLDRQATESFVDFRDLLALPDELFGVGHVLVLAAAAFPEEFAAGLDAGGGRDDHADEVATREVGGVMPDAGDDLFAG